MNDRTHLDAAIAKTLELTPDEIVDIRAEFLRSEDELQALAARHIKLEEIAA